MIDGTYSALMKTPMGMKKGDLVLEEKDGMLNGKMIFMGKENPISGQAAEGDHFHFEGVLQTAVGRIPFACDGTVAGDVLTASVQSGKGNFGIRGTRKQEA